jgi:tetratricopeptide (TPR) repeat protein
MIQEIVGLVESLTPIALIGTGGIGKTSIALTVLHHDRIKQRFGDDRRFIRCDQFPASRAHFLNRFSKAIGAGVENPEDLTPLRPFLSSKQILVILDNVESILDPQGPDAQEMYTVVEELSQLSNVCLCITSRISTVPPDCERLDVPTLSIEAACDVFYRIYRGGERSDLVNNILERLDLHPLSITLLATVAFHNTWDYHRLAREWEKRRTDILRTRHNKSLAATIELSLSSLTFQGLGPDARALLEVVAFFPQGVDESKCDWLFPTISDVLSIFDQFCALSLTHRNNGFITMLAPLRDHIGPKDPLSSPLLRAIKDRYFLRLSVDIYPDKEGYEETKWIISEDVNVEHLLDVLLSIDSSSPDVLEACVHFMEHLYWHKRRLVVLGPKIEGIPDDHPSKPRCLYQLSWLFQLVGNDLECRRLLVYALKLSRERRDDVQVAKTLRFLADANRLLGLREEGIWQVKEALEIDERLDDVTGQVHSLRRLAELLYDDKQFGAAEEVAYRAIDLLSDSGSRFLLCQCHRILGLICRSKGEVGKAIHHLNVALRIASPFNWHDQLFWVHYALAGVFHEEGRTDEADASIENAKSHAVGDAYLIGRATWLQAWFWFQQHKLEEAKSQALLAVDVYERVGAAADLESCNQLVRLIDAQVSELMTHRESGEDGEFVEVAILAPLIDCSF